MLYKNKYLNQIYNFKIVKVQNFIIIQIIQIIHNYSECIKTYPKSFA